MKKQAKRFDLYKKPNKPRWYLKIVEAVAVPFFNITGRVRVKKDKAIKKIKGPMFILATHQSFADFPIILKGIRPKNTTWVMSVEEFRRGEWLMRGVGGIPKRKFTHDIITAKNILYTLKKLKYTCAIYPEARFELAGINERIDGALGKMCKLAGVPVVMCRSNGSFLNSPQWCKHPYRKIRQEAEIYVLFTPEQLKQMPVEEIQAGIEQAFIKDEYKWQVDNNLHITCKERAKGIHNILYKCPHCGKEFEMDSAGTFLWCNACGAKWEMDTLSRLKGVNTDKGFEHVPDWYRWEREQVRNEVRSGNYCIKDTVRVEDYYSVRKGFINLGKIEFTHDKDGFTFKGTLDDGTPFELNKSVSSMYSVHIEYDFMKRGDCFEIGVENTSYFMYPQTLKCALTKIHFATEELFDYYVKENNQQ